jgi:hypothetical protein
VLPRGGLRHPHSDPRLAFRICSLAVIFHHVTACSASTKLYRPRIVGLQGEILQSCKSKLSATYDQQSPVDATNEAVMRVCLLIIISIDRACARACACRGRTRVAQKRQLWSKIILTRPRTFACAFPSPQRQGDPTLTCNTHTSWTSIAKHSTPPSSPPTTAARSGDPSLRGQLATSANWIEGW